MKNKHKHNFDKTEYEDELGQGDGGKFCLDCGAYITDVAVFEIDEQQT